MYLAYPSSKRYWATNRFRVWNWTRGNDFPLWRFQSGLHSWKLEFVFIDVVGFYILVRTPVALETPWSTSHCHGSLQMILQLHCCLWPPGPFSFSLTIYLGSLQNHTFSTEMRKSTYLAPLPPLSSGSKGRPLQHFSEILVFLLPTYFSVFPWGCSPEESYRFQWLEQLWEVTASPRSAEEWFHGRDGVWARLKSYMASVCTPKWRGHGWRVTKWTRESQQDA